MTDNRPTPPILGLHPEALKIKQQLIDDEINFDDAFERLKNLPKPWHRKEWKAVRDCIIKDHCERCDTKNGVMVLNHKKQPPDYYSILRQICEHEGATPEKYREKLYSKYAEEISKVPKEERECCPKCSSTSISFRKQKEIWVCKGSKSHRGQKIWCDHEFHIPHTKEEFTPDSKRKISAIKKEWYSEAHGLAKIEQSKYFKSALLKSFDYSEEYLSLKNTETLCKKCAFLWDSKQMVICKHCKERYIPLFLDGMPCKSCQNNLDSVKK